MIIFHHKDTPVNSSSTALTCISLGKQSTQRIYSSY